MRQNIFAATQSQSVCKRHFFSAFCFLPNGNIPPLTSLLQQEKKSLFPRLPSSIRREISRAKSCPTSSSFACSLQSAAAVLLYCCDSHGHNKSYPFVFEHYHSPCQDSKKCSSMPPKIQDRANFSLVSLSLRTRSRRGNSRGNEGRGALKPILEESARRNEKTLEILKCRDSDTEDDTVKNLFPTHGLGFVIHYVIYMHIQNRTYVSRTFFNCHFFTAAAHVSIHMLRYGLERPVIIRI